MKQSLNIAVVEPNHIVLEGLKGIFGRSQFKVTLECETIDGAWGRNTANSNIAAILVDLGHNIKTLDTDVARLRSEYPESRIVMLAEASPCANLMQAAQVGVDGLLLKSSRGQTLIKSLELILLGERLFPAELLEARWINASAPQSATEEASGQATHNLSSREIEVLRSLGDGSANKVIARRLGISEATVKVHVKAILRKTRAKNRTEAALWAKGVGLGQVDSHTG